MHVYLKVRLVGGVLGGCKLVEWKMRETVIFFCLVNEKLGGRKMGVGFEFSLWTHKSFSAK